MLSFLFVEEGPKLFIKKSSFKEFNLVFFTTERMVCFEMQPRQCNDPDSVFRIDLKD